MQTFAFDNKQYDIVVCKSLSILSFTETELSNCYIKESFITGCTSSYDFDNFQYNQWWNFRQNDAISLSVFSPGANVRSVYLSPGWVPTARNSHCLHTGLRILYTSPPIPSLVRLGR